MADTADSVTVRSPVTDRWTLLDMPPEMVQTYHLRSAGLRSWVPLPKLEKIANSAAENQHHWDSWLYHLRTHLQASGMGDWAGPFSSDRRRALRLGDFPKAPANKTTWSYWKDKIQRRDVCELILASIRDSPNLSAAMGERMGLYRQHRCDPSIFDDPAWICIQMQDIMFDHPPVLKEMKTERPRNNLRLE
ncbi:hypothetical protein B0T21DRAFT_415237 [Apiosordaria backusii]|uniref:Uncharacterized protein n=1 Tax=Apiosordaria backusii TaxID=314023 RepID=A0AA40AIM2_9PEZI|nr:hypothetical protein B0T21DRAFT_415237 [Apiosordaria backusii]